MAIPKPTTLNYDPLLPVYAQPETQQTATPLEEIPEPVIPEKATVSGQLKGILEEGSPVLRAAQAQSDYAYNARGLLQSQGGVRAGTAAVIDKALQIATPDATLYGNIAQTTQKAKTDAALNNQLANIELKKSKNNALIAGEFTKQEQAGRYELQKLADTAQIQRLEIDNQWKDMFNMDQMDTEEARSLLSVQGQLGADLTGGIERMLRDTNVTNKTEAIDALMTQYRAQMSTAAAIVGIELDWS